MRWFTFFLPLVFAGPVWAGLTVCNDTGLAASVAAAREQKGGCVSEGWWTIAVDQCAEMLNGDLVPGGYYWRANKHDQGALAWGERDFCVDAHPFRIEGDEDCVGNPGPRLSIANDGGEEACWGIPDQTSDRLRLSLRHVQDGTDITYEKIQ